METLINSQQNNGLKKMYFYEKIIWIMFVFFPFNISFLIVSQKVKFGPTDPIPFVFSFFMPLILLMWLFGSNAYNKKLSFIIARILNIVVGIAGLTVLGFSILAF